MGFMAKIALQMVVAPFRLFMFSLLYWKSLFKSGKFQKYIKLFVLNGGGCGASVFLEVGIEKENESVRWRCWG